MRNITLLVHISVDGFVAGPGGDLGYFAPSDENLAFVVGLTTNADTALFGRNTFHLLDTYWPQKHKDPASTQAEKDYSNWYNQAQKIVVSRTISEPNDDKHTIYRDLSELSAIKTNGNKDILVFGSPTLSQSLVEQGLLDDCRVFIHPAFFGNGLPLFQTLEKKINLILLETKPLPHNQYVLHYKFEQ